MKFPSACVRLVVMFLAPLSLALAATPVESFTAALTQLARASGYAWKTDVTNLNSGIPSLAQGATSHFEGEADAEGFSVGRQTDRVPHLGFARFQNQMLSRVGDANWLSLEEAIGQVNASGNVTISTSTPPKPNGVILSRLLGTGRMAPHDELTYFLANAETIEATAEGWSFALTPEASKLVTPYLGVAGPSRKTGSNPTELIRTSARVTVRMEAGVLTGFILQVDGKIVDRRGQENTVARTERVTLHDIGHAKVNLPEAVRTRLRSMASALKAESGR